MGRTTSAPSYFFYRLDLRAALTKALSRIARHQDIHVLSASGAPATFHPNRVEGLSQEIGRAFAASHLQRFIDTLIPCPCSAAAVGVCLMGTKAEVWSACSFLPRSNRFLCEISQAVCEHASTPLLVLLNGAGAALFEPRRRPQRILPASAFDESPSNCSFGLSIENVATLMTADPKPFESFEDFVRRVVGESQGIH